jgi:DNA-binding transcriptional ArsR family regulator
MLTIKVLGPGCSNCKALEAVARKAVDISGHRSRNHQSARLQPDHAIPDPVHARSGCQRKSGCLRARAWCGSGHLVAGRRCHAGVTITDGEIQMREYRKRAKILHAMSHPVRLQILDILAQRPTCVCDLIAQTRQRQAYISQHLMLLRQAGIVKSTRLGVNIQYELTQPETTKNMLNCLLQDRESKSSSKGETKMS